MNPDLIKIRRHEVTRELERLQERKDALTIEMEELDIAERVMGRLSGGLRSEVSPRHESKPPQASRPKTGEGMTVRQMVKEALMDARARGLPGLAPKHIRDYIQSTFGRDIGAAANTTASRMWREIKEISKDEKTGLFSLPQNEKPASAKSEQDTPAGLFPDQQQSREAETGGGT